VLVAREGALANLAPRFARGDAALSDAAQHRDHTDPARSAGLDC